MPSTYRISDLKADKQGVKLTNGNFLNWTRFVDGSRLKKLTIKQLKALEFEKNKKGLLSVYKCGCHGLLSYQS